MEIEIFTTKLAGIFSDALYFRVVELYFYSNCKLGKKEVPNPFRDRHVNGNLPVLTFYND